MQATAGTHSVATALVILAVGDKEITETASGDGPVNAVFEAINRITGLPGRTAGLPPGLGHRRRRRPGRGVPAGAFPEGTFSGKAASTDIVGSSAQAYLNAVNKVLQRSRTAEPIVNA